MSTSRASREFEECSPTKLRQEAQRALHVAHAEAARGGKRSPWRATAELLARAVLSLTDPPSGSEKVSA